MKLGCRGNVLEWYVSTLHALVGFWGLGHCWGCGSIGLYESISRSFCATWFEFIIKHELFNKSVESAMRACILAFGLWDGNVYLNASCSALSRF